MDTTERLVWNSEISAGVMGNGEDFILFRLDKPIDPATLAKAVERGLPFCGVLAVVDGRAVVEPAPQPEAARALMFAGLEFARSVADHLRPEPKGDACDWLQRLFDMPDDREVR